MATTCTEDGLDRRDGNPRGPFRDLACVGLFLAALLVPPAFGAGPHSGPSLANLTVGLDNRFKVGCWTEARVTVAGGGQPIEGSVEFLVADGDGLATRFSDPDGERDERLRIEPGRSVVVKRYIKIGRVKGRLIARFVSGGEALATASVSVGGDAIPVHSTQDWIVVVGSRLRIDKAMERRRIAGGYAPVVTSIEDAARLPESDLGYDGVDALVLTSSEPAIARAIGDVRRAAILDWLQLGGHAVLTLGANGLEVAGTDGPWTALTPVRVVGVERNQAGPGLEAFARAEQPLKPFAASRIDAGTARVVAYLDRRTSGEVPGILRYPIGLGRGTVVTFDIDAEPFASWNATPGLLFDLVFPGESETAAAQAPLSRRVTHIGYEEMAGQLRAALDHFPATASQSAVRLVSFTTVMLIVGIYAVLIGPGDFFLLSRFVGRMEWTWATYPLLIGGACGLIVFLGHRWHGGAAPRLKAVEVVDIDLESGRIRGTVWAHLYSPATRSFDVELRPRWPLEEPRRGEPRARLAWQGLPGAGLGGFDTMAAETLAPDLYSLVSNKKLGVRLAKLPVTAGATKSLIGQWSHRRAFANRPALTVDGNGFLRGTIANPLREPLDDAFIVHGQFTYRIARAWRPGEPIALEGLERRDLQWRLTRRKIVDSKTSYATTPWDPRDRDIPRILEIMMLHEAAGGPQYTGLTQKYQAFVDLSGLVGLGRALIVGRGPSACAELVDAAGAEVVAQREQWTWYRIVVPVEPLNKPSVEGTAR
ncbi:MAG: hypothetical protein FJ297_16950 [Planctomycetes bacterium]|nr:hypothetical protein [Planctomycetota bacterium]